jgi:hypothetical protein
MSEDKELYSKEGKHNEEVKRAYKREKKTKQQHPQTKLVASLYTRFNGDLNRIAATSMLPKHTIEEILKNENI